MGDGTGCLVERVAVPVESEPREILENEFRRAGLHSLPIQVLDPEHDAAALGACGPPRDEEGARMPEVEAPRGGRGQAADDFGGVSQSRSV